MRIQPEQDPVETVAEGDDSAQTRLIPHLGISSFLHLGALVALYVCGQSYGAVKEAPIQRVDYVAQKPAPMLDPPQPEPTVKLNPDLPSDRGPEDLAQVDLPITGVRGPIEPEIATAPDMQTDDDEPGVGPKGSTIATGENMARQIDNFIKGPGMKAPIGKGPNGTGGNERFGRPGPGGHMNYVKPGGGGKQTEDAVRKALE